MMKISTRDKKKVLVLEDDPRRISKFKQRYAEDDLFLTGFAKDAIEQLNKEKYDLISLDHDLDGNIFVDPTIENCGTTVAKAIPNSINLDTKVIVHSHNHIESPKMVEIIGSNAKWEPFQ